MSKRPVAFRVPRLLGDMVSHYFVTTSEDEARAMADTNQVEYEGLYLVGDRHTGDDAQACAVRLEARPADNSKEWTEIFPAQLEWVAKAGHQVRAIELAAQPPAAPVELPEYEYVEGQAVAISPGPAAPVDLALLNEREIIRAEAEHSRSSAGKATAPWVCCRCDAPLTCAACGFEQPNDSEHYQKLQDENDRLRAVPQPVGDRYVHIDNVVYHLDDVEVDADGKCAWADVANALTHIKLCIEIRTASCPLPRPQGNTP